MKRFGVGILVLGLYSACFAPAGYSQNLTKGLVGYWSFCGCSLIDQTGHGHDGIATNNPGCNPGKFDQAFDFDETNYIGIPFSSAFDIPQDSALTLAAWVKPDRAGGYQALVVKGSDVWDYGLYIDISGSFMFGCQWPNHETFSKTIPKAGTWYYVVGVYRNRDWKLYVNGRLEDELASGTTIGRSGNPIGFAIKGNYFKDMYAGTLDEVRLYNRALSDSEVMALYLWQPSGTLSLSQDTIRFAERDCTGSDTTIQVVSFGCGTVSIDSAWITGSSAFRIIRDSFPLQIIGVDSIALEYSSPAARKSDTAAVHLRYRSGNAGSDTTILLFGTGGHDLQFLHREATSAYYGQIDSLTMTVDLSSSLNLDSLWPYITDIQGTFAFDSSVVSFASYMPPMGWTLSTLTNHGNAVDFGIHKFSAASAKPLALGTALFLPATDQLATTWVTLPRFVLHVGGKDVSLCVTQNEDSHWSVKTLGAQSGVSEARPVPSGNISIYPNPTADRLFIRNPFGHAVAVTIYDAIGREVLSAQIPASSTGSVSLATLPRGMYIVTDHSGGSLIVSHE